jgi:hypothetical protein
MAASFEQKIRLVRELSLGVVARFAAGSTRFHPKRRASIDHNPGSSTARAPPMVASRRATHLSPGTVIICHVSSTATSTPTMGVQRPGIRRSPSERCGHCLRSDRRAAPQTSEIERSWNSTYLVRQGRVTLRTRRTCSRQLGGFDAKRRTLAYSQQNFFWGVRCHVCRSGFGVRDSCRSCGLPRHRQTDTMFDFADKVRLLDKD